MAKFCFSHNGWCNNCNTKVSVFKHDGRWFCGSCNRQAHLSKPKMKKHPSNMTWCHHCGKWVYWQVTPADGQYWCMECNTSLGFALAAVIKSSPKRKTAIKAPKIKRKPRVHKHQVLPVLDYLLSITKLWHQIGEQVQSLSKRSFSKEVCIDILNCIDSNLIRLRAQIRLNKSIEKDEKNRFLNGLDEFSYFVLDCIRLHEDCEANISGLFGHLPSLRILDGVGSEVK